MTDLSRVCNRSVISLHVELGRACSVGGARLVLTAMLGVLMLLACLGFAIAADTSAASSQGSQHLPEPQLWKLLAEAKHSKEHYAVLIRHALAPGTGDPATFVVDDCATQRNLSDEGREQARGIGLLFVEQGVSTARIYSSAWCRCLETARLMGLAPVEILPSLNSFFQQPSQRVPQSEQTLRWLEQQINAENTAADDDKTGKAPLVLVTHQVNITALSGIYPGSGELVVVQLLDSPKRDDDSAGAQLKVLGTIKTH